MTAKQFSSSADVFKWIEGFINYERVKPSFRNFRLERMEILSSLAGHPERSCPVIHAAGSKGKGSVTGMIAGILEAGGIATARYASPHVSDYRERVGGAKGFFSEGIYTAAGEELALAEKALREAGEETLKKFSGGESGDGALTFFELITLYFFLCARRAGAKAMAVETGLGGRLDATNIVDPLVSVITLIEKEHTEYLGTTLGAIAAEKAGIIKPRRPLVLGPQGEEALRVIKEKAAAVSAPLHYFPGEGEINNVRVQAEGTSFTLRLFPPGGEERVFPDLFIPIPGEIQALNGGLAVLAAYLAFPDLGDGAIRAGLGGFTLPGRFERLPGMEPPWIVDGAHTPLSVEACVKTFVRLYGEGGILLFGCAVDKDAQAMAAILAPHFSRILITAPGTFKKSDPEAVFRAFSQRVPGNKAEVLLVNGTGEGIAQARELSRKQGLPVLGTGSFYLAGEIRGALIQQDG